MPSRNTTHIQIYILYMYHAAKIKKKTGISCVHFTPRKVTHFLLQSNSLSKNSSQCFSNNFKITYFNQ